MTSCTCCSLDWKGGFKSQKKNFKNYILPHTCGLLKEVPFKFNVIPLCLRQTLRVFLWTHLHCNVQQQVEKLLIPAFVRSNSQLSATWGCQEEQFEVDTPIKSLYKITEMHWTSQAAEKVFQKILWWNFHLIFQPGAVIISRLINKSNNDFSGKNAKHSL